MMTFNKPSGLETHAKPWCIQNSYIGKNFWVFYPLHSATESTDKQALTIFWLYTNDLDADYIIYKREGFLAELHELYLLLLKHISPLPRVFGISMVGCHLDSSCCLDSFHSSWRETRTFGDIIFYETNKLYTLQVWLMKKLCRQVYLPTWVRFSKRFLIFWSLRHYFML